MKLTVAQVAGFTSKKMAIAQLVSPLGKVAKVRVPSMATVNKLGKEQLNSRAAPQVISVFPTFAMMKQFSGLTTMLSFPAMAHVLCGSGSNGRIQAFS